jgi:hypothetical protein
MMVCVATFPPADRVELYERLVATVPAVERRGATMPYTSVNGNMFSYLNADGALALRLPAPARDEFIARYRTALASPHGVVQAEYVAVPGDLLERTDELAPYFTASYEYTASLKPKATTRKRERPRPAVCSGTLVGWTAPVPTGSCTWTSTSSSRRSRCCGVRSLRASR